MIEIFAVALCFGFVVCALEYLNRGRVWLLGLGSVLAIAAGLTRSTTFGIYAVFVFLLFAWEFGKLIAARDKAGDIVETGFKWFSYGVGLFLPALIIAGAWIAFSDQIKASSPLTQFITSDALTRFNYGDASDRVANLTYLFSNYREISPSIFSQVFGALWFVPVGLAVAGLALRPLNRIGYKLSLLGGFLAGPMIFANLYEVHYYYWVANTPMLILLAAFGIDDWVSWVEPKLQGLPISAGLLWGWARRLRPFASPWPDQFT